MHIHDLSRSEADDAKTQYDEFLKSVVVTHKESFDGFEYEAHRFLSVYLIGQKSMLWYSKSFNMCAFFSLDRRVSRGALM